MKRVLVWLNLYGPVWSKCGSKAAQCTALVVFERAYQKMVKYAYGGGSNSFFLGLRKFSNLRALHEGLLTQDWG